MIHISRKQKVWLILSVMFLVLFVAWTLIVMFVDVDQVGLSHLNQFFWQHCGVNEIWEQITDWLGYLLILAVLGLLILQVVQLIRRKSLWRVDKNLLILDIIMVCLVAVYLFFEIVIINYRPLLDNGVAKASYPSSHAMLFATVLPLLIGQVWYYINSKPWCVILTIFLVVLLMLGLAGRMLSGVHWFTDIVGGVIVSFYLDCMYFGFIKKTCKDF